jgi:hypothetical protein
VTTPEAIQKSVVQAGSVYAVTRISHFSKFASSRRFMTLALHSTIHADAAVHESAHLGRFIFGFAFSISPSPVNTRGGFNSLF